MSILDEETRQIILKKTWCHGQFILPIYSILLIVWSYHVGSFILVAPAFFLIFWSWFSYRVVFHYVLGSGGTSRPTVYPKICILGILAMMSHLITFLVAIQQRTKEGTTTLLIRVASGLLFVETGAFLIVVTALREEIEPTTHLVPTNISD